MGISHGGSRQSGFTLAEVAVAVAIFVIGALAIVRIFPPALAVIQNTENRTIAHRMDRSRLATLSAQPDLVADAVFDAEYIELTPPTRVWRWNQPVNTERGGKAIALVGTINRNYSLPRVPDAIENSALAHYRHIRGEKHRVREENGAKFVVTQFPYAQPIGAISDPAPVVWEEGAINGVKINDQGELDFTDATRASNGDIFSDVGDKPESDDVIDGDGGVEIAERPHDEYRITLGDVLNPEIIYYVSYRWIQGTRVQGVVDEPLLIESDTEIGSTGWGASGNDSGKVLQGRLGKTIISGAINVRYRKRLPANPLVFADAIRGYLPITGANSGDRVSVDYDVPDWRWMVEENPLNRVAPTPTPAATTPPPADNRRVMSLLVKDLEDGLTTVKAIEVDSIYTMLTGMSGTNPVRRSSSWPTGGNALLEVRHKSGQVVFDISSNPAAADYTPLRSPRARVVYRTLDGWAHQLAVAASSYVPFYPRTMADAESRDLAMREPWREYYWMGEDASPLNGNLYFHPSEAGRALMVSYEYWDGATTHDVVGSIVTVDDDVEPWPFDASIVGADIAAFYPGNDNRPAPGLFGFPGTVVKAELTDLQGNRIGPAAGHITAIKEVRGVGLRARTAWMDNGRYAQSSVVGYRTVSN